MKSGTFTTSDLSRRSGDVIAEALRHPVMITQRNKARLVILSIDEYRALRLRADSRVAATIADMDEELLTEVEATIEAYASDATADG
jgi:prevent-host-death family protein